MITPEETAVRNYLAPPRESPWSWRDEGQSIGWNDGPTIAFRPEIEAVLRRLAPNGLPPFGAVLWLLAACRDGEAGIRAAAEMTAQFGAFQGLLGLLGSPLAVDHDVVSGLLKVTGLPVELRGSLDAKATLAELVFENSDLRTTHEVTGKILGGLSHGLSIHIVGIREAVARTLHIMLTELRTLRAGLARVSQDALTNRRRTGLDQSVLPATIDLNPLLSVRNLLGTLRDDAELSGIASLAQQLMVVTQLPRAVSDLSELPMGGVSDITNRGDWDRLLLSELAHDDITLMARLANSEAMFLRRERPPKPPQRCRAVLVDTGLRMWGVPRVFAAAVALAFAATSDRQSLSRTWRLSDRNDVEPVDLTTREGLINLLESLTMSRHPGHALPELLVQMEIVEQSVEPSSAPVDVVLITTDDVLADREFQQSLAHLPQLTLYLATVNREGEFRLQVHSARGTKRLREATLSLDEIVHSRTSGVPLIDKDAERNLPAILRMLSFPLRLWLIPLTNAFWPGPNDGTFAISGNGCLLRWSTRDSGGELIFDRLPKGDLRWYGTPDRNGTTRALIGSACGPLTLISIDIQNQVTLRRIGECRPKPYTSIVWHRERLLLFSSDCVELMDPEDGRVLSRTSFHGRSILRQHGRFYEDPVSWRSISHDGRETVDQPLVWNNVIHLSKVVAVFEPSHIDGPVLYLSDGTLHTSDGTQILIAKSDASTMKNSVIATSADANRVLFSPHESANGQQTGLLVNFFDRRASSVLIDQHWRKHVEPEAANRIMPGNVRSVFNSVGFDEERLQLNASKLRVFDLNFDGIKITWKTIRSPAIVPNYEFVPIKLPGDIRYSMSASTFADGSRCLLDSRGMLHCQSSDHALPEFTLMLIDGEAAGWSADDRTFGHSYFLGRKAPVLAAEFWIEVIRPFLRRLS